MCYQNVFEFADETNLCGKFRKKKQFMYEKVNKENYSCFMHSKRAKQPKPFGGFFCHSCQKDRSTSWTEFSLSFSFSAASFQLPVISFQSEVFLPSQPPPPPLFSSSSRRGLRKGEYISDSTSWERKLYLRYQKLRKENISQIP